MDIEQFGKKLDQEERKEKKAARQSAREAKRMNAAEQLSWRNRRCHQRALKINKLTAGPQAPMVILGKLEEKNGYAAAKVHADTEMDAYSKNNSRAVINYYFLTEAEAEQAKKSPLSFEDGRWVGQEQALVIVSRGDGYRDDLKQTAGEWTTGRAINPIGAVHRRIQVRKAENTVSHFEDSLDYIETAISDPEINPGLVELINPQNETIVAEA